jgi:lysozyme
VINQVALTLLKGFEQCRLVAFLPVPDDPWTIGWGATGPGIEAGTAWTQQQADDRLTADLARFEQAIQNSVEVDLTDNQYGALVCLVYNIGAGNFNQSHLLQYLNAGKLDLVAQEWLKWDKAHGETLDGLLRRRQAELALFQTPDAS